MLCGDETQEPPYPWVISVICEEFKVPPSVAEAELDADLDRDEPLLFDILDLRRLRDDKRAIDRATARGERIDATKSQRELMALEYRLHCERKGITPTE
jgi:hypothetical protein